MAETWECEWWIENHKICFGRCEYSSPVDFKAGDLTDTENVNVNQHDTQRQPDPLMRPVSTLSVPPVTFLPATGKI